MQVGKLKYSYHAVGRKSDTRSFFHLALAVGKIRKGRKYGYDNYHDYRQRHGYADYYLLFFVEFCHNLYPFILCSLSILYYVLYSRQMDEIALFVKKI